MTYLRDGKFVVVEDDPGRPYVVPDPNDYPKIVQYDELFGTFRIAVGEDGSVWSIRPNKAIRIEGLCDITTVLFKVAIPYVISYLITKGGSAIVARISFHGDNPELCEKQVYEYPAEVLYHYKDYVVCSNGIVYYKNTEKYRYVRRLSGPLILHECGAVTHLERETSATRESVCYISNDAILTDTGNLYDNMGKMVISGMPNPGNVLQIHRCGLAYDVLYDDHTLVMYRPRIGSDEFVIKDTVHDIDCISGQIDRRVPTKRARN